MNNDQRPVINIAFEEGHKERGRIGDSLSELVGILQNWGFACQSFAEFPLTYEKLDYYDILVFACPDNSKISKHEINDIAKWVKNGGGLLMLSHAGGDKGRRSNLSELGEQFGIMFENDQVLDEVNNLSVENLPTISEFLFPHPIVEKVGEICYRAGCSLSITGQAIVPVVSSGPNANPAESPLILAGEVGEGRVVGIGSYEMFRNRITGGLAHGYHHQLVYNIFEWLTTSARIKRKSLMNYEDPIKEEIPPSGYKEYQNVMTTPSSYEIPLRKIASKVKIITSQDLFTAFEDILTNFFSFKERFMLEFDTLQHNLTKLIESVIASEKDMINFQELTETITRLEVGGETVNINREQSNEMQKMDQSTLEAIQSLDKFQSETKIQQDEQKAELEAKQQENLQISDPIVRPQSINRPILEKTPAQIKAELESLENKLNSINNLNSFVDKKYENGKLSEEKYKRQISKLEKDKKKTIEKIQKLQEKLE